MVTYPHRTAPPEAFKTFGIHRPLKTHWRPASCAEVECDAHVRGFTVRCDLRTVLGLDQARYIRDKAGRAYTHAFAEDGKVIVFTFPAGQRCFKDHRRVLDRPALFVVRNGDHRGAGRRRPERRVFDRPDQWVDTFAEHQDRLATAAQRG